MMGNTIVGLVNDVHSVAHEFFIEGKGKYIDARTGPMSDEEFLNQISYDHNDLQRRLAEGWLRQFHADQRADTRMAMRGDRYNLLLSGSEITNYRWTRMSEQEQGAILDTGINGMRNVSGSIRQAFQP